MFRWHFCLLFRLTDFLWIVKWRKGYHKSFWIKCLIKSPKSCCSISRSVWLFLFGYRFFQSRLIFVFQKIEKLMAYQYPKREGNDNFLKQRQNNKIIINLQVSFIKTNSSDKCINLLVKCLYETDRNIQSYSDTSSRLNQFCSSNSCRNDILNWESMTATSYF